MPEKDLHARLDETAAEFVALRGELQRAGALAVVNASPLSKKRIDAFANRATKIQAAIESTGRMIDGARRWFSDTFGMPVEESVPLANPAIEASVQASIAAMKYFIRDARAELETIGKRQSQYEAFPEDKRDKVLSALHAEDLPAVISPPLAPKYVLLGLAAVAAYVWWKGNDDEIEA